MNRRVTVSVLTALAYVVALCLGAPTAGAVPAKKLDNNLAALWTKVDSTTVRFGGAFGILCALAMIPAYVVGTPDSPRTLQAAREYYDSGSAFVTANGTLPLLHILFGLAFLGVLVAMLRRASGPSAAVYTAFAGGVFFFAFALTAGGFAAEVAYPAAVVRFGDSSTSAVSGEWLPLLSNRSGGNDFRDIGGHLANRCVAEDNGGAGNPRRAAARALLDTVAGGAFQPGVDLPDRVGHARRAERGACNAQARRGHRIPQLC